MRLLILFCLLSCFPFSKQYGQTDEYVFSHLNVSNGLSSNHITCFFKDKKGFMWFGTVSGLNRYDGYQFKIYKHDPRDSNSITDNYIENIFEGPDGKLWISSRGGQFNIYDFATERFDQDYGAYLSKLSMPGYLLLNIARSKTGFWFVYQNYGLYHYLPDGKIIPLSHSNSDPSSIDSSFIANAEEDGNGFCWVIHQNGLLEKIDSRLNKVVYRTDILEKRSGNIPVPWNMFIDRQNDLWLYANGVMKGVYYYQPASDQLRHLSQDTAPGEGKLNSNIVYNALQDEKGMIWLATDHAGVDIVDKKDLSVKYIGHIEDDNKSIPENSIPTFYRDNTGTIWLGSYKSGISYYHQNRIQFPQYRHQPFNPASLSYDDVNGFAEDPAGNLWIASNGGGLIYFDRRRNSFRQYLHDPKNRNSLCNNIIVSILLDRENKLWLGTYFGGLDCYDGKTFTHYRHDDKQPASLAEDRVMSVYEDSDRNLWIGTLAGGLDRLDRKKNTFTHYTSDQPNSLRNNYVSTLAEDAQKDLWIGTAFGIDVLEKKTGKFIHYSNAVNQLSSDNIIMLFRDSHQRMWAGTREGLSLFDPAKKTFQTFRTEEGLPDNTIRSIQEDGRRQLWISTPNGISKVQVSPAPDHAGFRIYCENYHEQDGLQGREFNERAGLTTRDGMILFGGPNGFNIFHPENIVHPRETPPILFTGLDIFDKSVHVGEKIDGHVILNKSFTEAPEIRLNYRENVFSIEFASLGFIHDAKNKYAYILEGFNKNWLTTDGKIRKATYTNLDAGEYTFKVKASDEDGVWYDQVASLKIVVLPPFWKTPLAYFLYFLLSVAILILARRMVIQRASLRFAVENERQESRRMHEMDMMKIRFFTNMSHELRTPLSLILAPVDKLLSSPGQPHPEKQYALIRRNARRLLRLVNQLLDFRKIGINELKLHATQGDILRFIKDASFSFIDLAEKKNISFLYTSDAESLHTLFDHDKIESILFNLLSNAFKFTPEHGTVSVDVHTERTKKEELLLQIKVMDTGIGIPPEKQERIFIRFFQAEIPDTIVNQGSGIGLAITTEFVKMHNGTITVDSDTDKGSCFTVTLPFKEIIGVAADTPADSPEEADIPDAYSALPAGPHPSPDLQLYGNGNGNGNGLKKSSILIVEDNEEFRSYLKESLSPYYNIIEAADGKEGWRKSLAMHPDLVVSDISMPIMNGTDLCIKIKADERTRQIPVILLTALTGEDQELKGLKTGASDYITKPFNFEVLLSRLRNLLEYNEALRKTYQRQIRANPENIEIESADDAFIRDVLRLVEKNMSNANFSVGELSAELHASRSTIYKRILLLTGKTPIEFIRNVRLNRAAELLEKSQMSVSEIAYSVGFNNPKYFAQHFKMEFELVPSAYRQSRSLMSSGSASGSVPASSGHAAYRDASSEEE